MAIVQTTLFGCVRYALFTVCLLQPDAASAAGQTLVTISGGPDDTGHHYTWTVRNDHDCPIVFVEFPHYAADLFTPPTGWDREIVHPATGGPSREGRCRATAPAPSDGIVPGTTATFSLRLGPYAGTWGVRLGQGDALIRFADGTEVVLSVPAPRMESALSRHLPLLVVGVVLLVLASRGARRLRERRSA